jgi:transcriptional regulator with XRE-family HTH domain
MTGQHAPQSPQRHEIATALRGLREDANLSQPALAARLEWSQSRVSRIERGATLPTSGDVDQWAQHTDASPDTRRHLMTLAEQSRVELTEWRRELAPGRRRKQQEIARLEEGASVIRMFGADVVPGLAQTRAYARRMFLLGRPDVTDDPDDLDAVLDARMARQAVLDSGKHIKLLMSEVALRRQLVPGLVHREQIGRLVGLSTRQGVRVGVIPFAADEQVHQYHGYAILGDPDTDDGAVVLAETLTRGLTVRDPGEVALYVDHYERLDSTALHGDELQAFLLEVVAHVTWS